MVHSICEFFLTAVDGYNMNGSQVSLAVMLRLSGVVVDRAFISGRVHGNLFVDHHHVNVFIRNTSTVQLTV